MKEVRPVGAQDSADAPIAALQREGVAVLVDQGGKPAGVLTVCDLDSLKRRVNEFVAAGKAQALFDPKQEVYTVVDTQSIADVAKEVSRRRLGTGIVVVDESGRYRGYVFTQDLERSLDEFVRRGEEAVKQGRRTLGDEYPELRRRGLV